MRDDTSQPLIRRRLVDLVERRFDVRLTLLVAGGGAGKSTLLAQMAADDHGRRDVRVDARPADDLGSLCTKILRTMDHPHDTPSPAAVAEGIIARSPQHVCVVIDDAHHLTNDAVLGELLEELPRTGHLLVSSRRRPSLATTRLEASHGVLEIDHQDLLLTESELIEFSRRRRVDVDTLDEAGGWPAFVELAARGHGRRGREFLEEEAVGSLTPEHVRALAQFAYIGGGDDLLCRRATGWALEDLIDGVPLIMGSVEQGVRPHDLWLEIVGDRLTDAQAGEAATAAAEVLAERGELDQAIELCAKAKAWVELMTFFRTACLEVAGGHFKPDRLARWVQLLPAGDYDESGEAAFVRGLYERELDAASERCWSQFESAAQRFRDRGDALAELAVLAQMGYVARWGSSPDRLFGVVLRAIEMHEQGCLEAQPFVEFGVGWQAMMAGDFATLLDCMSRIDDAAVPSVWRDARDQLISLALTNSGLARTALERFPQGVMTDGSPLPGTFAINEMAEWFAGHPERIFARGLEDIHAGLGIRDRQVATHWRCMVYATAGRLDQAEAAKRLALRCASQEPTCLERAQLDLLDLLPLVAKGREEEAAVLANQLGVDVADEPGGALSFFRHACALSYVLMQDLRDEWDGEPLAGSFEASRKLAAILVAYREHNDLGPARLASWPEPGVACALLPVAWVIELALIGAKAGAPAAPGLAAWACEHLGAPAREVLRRRSEDDSELAEHASVLLALAPTPPNEKTKISVLGPMEIWHGSHPSSHGDWRRERVRALLLYLTLRTSVTRDVAAADLWPNLPADKADKNLRTTLSYLHGVLEPMRQPRDAAWFIRNENGMLFLHPSVDVDVWRFDALLDRADEHERTGASTKSLTALVAAAELWRGDLAAGEADHPWADLHRTRLRSRFVRAATRAAELLVATGRADEAIRISHRAIETDPWHEAAYGALARGYSDLGDRTSAQATIDTARDALGELGYELSAATLRIVTR